MLKSELWLTSVLITSIQQHGILNLYSLTQRQVSFVNLKNYSQRYAKHNSLIGMTTSTGIRDNIFLQKKLFFVFVNLQSIELYTDITDSS